MHLKDPIKSPAVVYNNQRVAIGNDLVFGWVTLTVPEDSDQTVWTPISQLQRHEQEHVFKLVDHGPAFPQEFHTWVAEQRQRNREHTDRAVAAAIGSLELVTNTESQDLDDDGRPRH